MFKWLTRRRGKTEEEKPKEKRLTHEEVLEIIKQKQQEEAQLRADRLQNMVYTIRDKITDSVSKGEFDIGSEPNQIIVKYKRKYDPYESQHPYGIAYPDSEVKTALSPLLKEHHLIINELHISGGNQDVSERYTLTVEEIQK